MKTYPDPRPQVRVPAFYPVPTRTRADGWTPRRQAQFIGHLAATGSVSAAARKVGMGRESAHRLRQREGAASFAAAWDAVLVRPGETAKVTPLDQRARQHFVQMRPIVRRGKVVGVAEKHDNKPLLKLLRQLGRAAARGRQAAESHAQKHAGSVQVACPSPPSPAT